VHQAYDDGPPTLISDEALVLMDAEDTGVLPGPLVHEADPGDTARLPRLETDETAVIPPVPADPSQTSVDPATVQREHMLAQRHRAAQEFLAPPPHVTYEVPPAPKWFDPAPVHADREELFRPAARTGVSWHAVRPRLPALPPLPFLRRGRHGVHAGPDSWGAAFRDIARDPNSLLGLIILLVIGSVVCWGTMVAFAPGWVPPVVNPRADEPGSSGSPWVPPVLRGDPVRRPAKPLESTGRPVPSPSKAPGVPGAPAPAESPSQGVSPQPSEQPSDPVTGTPTDPGQTPSGGPTDPGPTPTPSPTQTRPEPTESSEPTVTPTQTRTASPEPEPEPTTTMTATSEPTPTASEPGPPPASPAPESPADPSS
jgi:hypothetical protein